MLDQFKVSYIPGGMQLIHSGWWLTQRINLPDGSYYDRPIKCLRKADYK